MMGFNMVVQRRGLSKQLRIDDFVGCGVLFKYAYDNAIYEQFLRSFCARVKNCTKVGVQRGDSLQIQFAQWDIV